MRELELSLVEVYRLEKANLYLAALSTLFPLPPRSQPLPFLSLFWSSPFWVCVCVCMHHCEQPKSIGYLSLYTKSLTYLRILYWWQCVYICICTWSLYQFLLQRWWWEYSKVWNFQCITSECNFLALSLSLIRIHQIASSQVHGMMMVCNITRYSCHLVIQTF